MLCDLLPSLIAWACKLSNFGLFCFLPLVCCLSFSSTVIGCRELTGSKRNGLRNPSMRVRCGKKVVETRAEVSTLSPRFNEVFVFTVKHLMGGIHLACYEKGRSGAQARSERAADGSIRIKRRDTRFRSISSKSDKKVVPGSGKGEIGVGAFSLEDCSVEAGVQRKEIKLLQRMAGQQEVAGVVNLRLEVVPELEQSKLLQEERPMYIFLHGELSFFTFVCSSAFSSLSVCVFAP